MASFSHGSPKKNKFALSSLRIAHDQHVVVVDDHFPQLLIYGERVPDDFGQTIGVRRDLKRIETLSHRGGEL